MSTTTTETVDTRSQEEYDSYCRQKDSAQASYDTQDSYVAELEEKLGRLKTAYTEMKALKEAVEDDWKYDVKGCYKDYNSGGYHYKGVKYDKMVSDVDGDIKFNYNWLAERLDIMLDAIGDLKTEYENKIIDEKYILADLLKALNSWWDKVKNYWN